MYVELWCRVVRVQVPSSRPRAYADDIGATAPSAQDIEQVLLVTEEYAAASDMHISAGKSGV